MISMESKKSESTEFAFTPRKEVKNKSLSFRE